MINTYTFGILLFMLVLAIRLLMKKTISSKPYLVLVLTLFASGLLQWLFELGVISNPKTTLFNVLWTGVLVATAILVMVFSYLPRTLRLSRRWLVPIVFGAIVSSWFLAALDPSFLDANGFFAKKLTFGILLWLSVHKLFVELLLLASIVVIVRNLTPGNFISSAAFYIALAVAAIFYASIGNDALLPDAIFLVFLGSTLVIGVALVMLGNRQLFMSRNFIFNEAYIGGWVLIDSRKRIVDINAQAKKLLGLTNVDLVRRNAVQLLSHFPAISDALRRNMDVEVRTSAVSRGTPAYVHLRLNRISRDDALDAGYLLFVRDETKRKQMNTARQEARDEMFGLLHSISGAAGNAENLDEFISAAMHQISHSFQSNKTLVFLSDKPAAQGPLPLVAQIGVDSEYLRNISFIEASAPIVKYLGDSKKAVRIRQTQYEEYFSPKFIETLSGDVIAAPILDDDILVGVLLMTKTKGLFGKTDIIRTEIAMQEIATFINSERRRHAASTLAERQRLIRDLHDSVTQRLYSLVMLTEAARLELGLKGEGDQMKFVEEFGFSARQALKEMRLFLYKMQPVDMRGGFVNVLMHRLDAVEGRAGLEIDLKVEPDISLNAETELHLYMIAQEALNNIIKHANASKIAVHYKITDGYVSLIIYDNGDGFLQEANQLGGLGLRNIRERVELIGGNMQLKSTEGKGTTITVVLPEDQVVLKEGEI
jgi:PAS domain S-box-containing protein